MAKEKAKEGVCRSDGRAVVCDAKVQTNRCMLNCAHPKVRNNNNKKKKKKKGVNRMWVAWLHHVV